MFDVTAQLVNNQDEINGLDKIQWEKYSWKRLSLIGDETVVVPREDPSTSGFQRSLEKQNCRGQIREKLQRL